MSCPPHQWPSTCPDASLAFWSPSPVSSGLSKKCRRARMQTFLEPLRRGCKHGPFWLTLSFLLEVFSQNSILSLGTYRFVPLFWQLLLFWSKFILFSFFLAALEVWAHYFLGNCPNLYALNSSWKVGGTRWFYPGWTWPLWWGTTPWHAAWGTTKGWQLPLVARSLTHILSHTVVTCHHPWTLRTDSFVCNAERLSQL